MKKMKRRCIRNRALISGALALAAVLTACVPVTGPESSGIPAGKGLVNIQLGVDEPAAPASSAARTLAPGSVDASAFSSYTLVFTPSGGGDPVSLENQTDLSGISLDVGTYSLSLSAYTVSGESKLEAAAGNAAGIAVTDGTTTPVTVPLVFKPGAGTGTLSFTVTRPSGFDLSGARFSLTPLHIGGTTYGTDWLNILYTGEKKTSHSSIETIESGYYRAVVTLTAAEREAVKSDIVHIGAGQATTLNWTFEETDFSTTITEMWLAGVMNNWTLPGTSMTAEANGIFTWEGEIGTADPAFKFSLTDTTDWGDPWNGNWFAPSITSTPDTRETVSVGNNIPMIFVPTNTTGGATSATESAWKMSAAGYYRLIVNPYAKTFDIEAPVVVTGVTITGGNVNINKGASKTFSAVVNGHNSPGQEVTWSITTAYTGSTTAFSGNTLTIDSGETASTLTIRAASTVNTAIYGEITVTVQDAAAPVVSGIVVTAQGGVTEILRSAGTLQFIKTVTASNGATEDVTWSVSGEDKDGTALASITSTINTSGLLTIAADEAAVDLVVRATSQEPGFTSVYGEAIVFVRTLGAVYLIGDEFDNWTGSGMVEMIYAGRGVYTKTEPMSKGKSFRFRDDSATPNHFEPYPDGQVPDGTVDAWQHLSTDAGYSRTAWTTTQGGSYGISLDTVTEKAAFTRTDITGVTVDVTYGHPMTAVTKINNIIAPNASVTWTVEKSGTGAGPYSKTYIDQNGWLTLDNYEPAAKQLIVRAASNYNETVSGICTFTIDKYPNVWLVGDMQGTWSLPGILMERSQDGQTFTWQGTISQNQYFRFNRSSLDQKGDSEWTRDWLAIEYNSGNPRQINTASSGDDCKVNEWNSQSPSGNVANWQFNGSTGTYKITMDVSAMTIHIESVP